MDDRQIVDLFKMRSGRAIVELSEKYGKLCLKIANDILSNPQDAEECVNDTYLGVWNSIPPQDPDPFRAYVCRIVRNLSLKKYRHNSAKKRKGEREISLYELADCIPDNSFYESMTVKELTVLINEFVSSLSSDDRIMFVKRYWFIESISDISTEFGIKEHNVSVRLSRIRQKLSNYLKENGVYV